MAEAVLAKVLELSGIGLTCAGIRKTRGKLTITIKNASMTKRMPTSRPELLSMTINAAMPNAKASNQQMMWSNTKSP